MITVWWSQASLFHYEFLPAGETITAKKYCTQIEEIHKKLVVVCPAMVNKKTSILLHDNDRPHVAHKTLPYLPYSPDLSPTDYHFFKVLDHLLSGKLKNN